KTLGMTRRGVAAMLATEYALTGVVAGLVGAAGGNLLAWSVLTRGLEMGWRFEPAILALAVAASVLLTALTGVAASWPALRRRPLSLLSSY
ncbi:MAG: FtsX-like permease family protein, partial [Thermoanaerobaculia bacterium]